MLQQRQILLNLIQYLGGTGDTPSDDVAMDAVIDCPQMERQSGRDGFLHTLESLRFWLTNETDGLTIRNILITETGRFAMELAAKLVGKSYPTLPIAAAGDMKNARVASLRLYHSTWALTEGHAVRKPLFTRTVKAQLPDDIRLYQKALDQGDLDMVMSLFHPSALSREPSGDLYGGNTSHHLLDFFRNAFRDGGIRLTYHTYLEFRNMCAAEYTCTYWGNQEIPPQPGIEFWDRDAGQFKAVRIYDDIEQPKETKSPSPVFEQMPDHQVTADLELSSEDQTEADAALPANREDEPLAGSGPAEASIDIHGDEHAVQESDDIEKANQRHEDVEQSSQPPEGIDKKEQHHDTIEERLQDERDKQKNYDEESDAKKTTEFDPEETDPPS